jgi:hypothetical protein
MTTSSRKNGRSQSAPRRKSAKPTKPIVNALFPQTTESEQKHRPIDKIHRASTAKQNTEMKKKSPQGNKLGGDSSHKHEQQSREKVIFRKSNSFGEFQVQNLNKSSKKIDFSIVE